VLVAFSIGVGAIVAVLLDDTVGDTVPFGLGSLVLVDTTAIISIGVAEAEGNGEA
jgi:hypothetical protein